MAKTIWDVISEVLQKYGLAGIMFLFITYMYVENLTYERTNDKALEKSLNEVSAKIQTIDYKVSNIDESVDRLEERVFFSVDTKNDGDVDDEFVIVDYIPEEVKNEIKPN